ncbi:MAG: hypothetical protein PHE59_03095 [Patescibacteria group bacterium]|nr:hypothetical protein [Patescibacteria group bacterium]MDD5164622.1 hypothetical protein [Patescibacteria group bacterium]MDD5534536.1 hypothetical protein [Patescibacteria group bacterium]
MALLNFLGFLGLWYVKVVISLFIIFMIICFIQSIGNKILKKRFPDDAAFIKYMRQFYGFKVLLDYAESKGITVKMGGRRNGSWDMENKIITIDIDTVFKEKYRLMGMAFFAHQIGHIESFDPQISECRNKLREKNSDTYFICYYEEKMAWEAGSKILDCLELLIPEYWRYYERQCLNNLCPDFPCPFFEKNNTKEPQTT